MALNDFAFLMLVISMGFFAWALLRTVNMVDKLHKRIARLEMKQWDIKGLGWKEENND